VRSTCNDIIQFLQPVARLFPIQARAGPRKEVACRLEPRMVPGTHSPVKLHENDSNAPSPDQILCPGQSEMLVALDLELQQVNVAMECCRQN